MSGYRVLVRWALTSALDAVALAALEARLDADERARQARLRLPEDRRDYAAAHALLRVTLSEYSAAFGVPPECWRFVRDASGKPHVSPGQSGTPPLAFSLTHTRGLVACGVTRGLAVGIDAENVDRRADVDLVARRVCTEAERAQIASAGPAARARFIELWTLKEAAVKGLGVGITMPLDQVSFDLRDAPPIRASLPAPHAGGWLFELYEPSAETRIAIALGCHGRVTPTIEASGADLMRL